MYRKDLWDEIGMMPETWDDIADRRCQAEDQGPSRRPVARPQQRSEPAWRGLLWSYGASVQDESGKHVTLDSKEAVEAVKLAVALYKEAITPEVLSWDDASNNKYIDSGVGSFIINPISAYRTAQQINPEARRQHLRDEAARRVRLRQLIGAASNSYGIWKFAKNKEAGLEFLKYYADNWVRRLQGEHRLQHADLRQYRAEADADPEQRSDLASADQAGGTADLGRVVRGRRLARPRLGGDRRGLQRLCPLRHDDKGGDRRR